MHKVANHESHLKDLEKVWFQHPLYVTWKNNVKNLKSEPQERVNLQSIFNMEKLF